MSGICLLLKLLCLQKQKAVPSARENIAFIAVYQCIVIINTFPHFVNLFSLLTKPLYLPEQGRHLIFAFAMKNEE